MGKHLERLCLICDKNVSNWSKHLKDMHKNACLNVPWAYATASSRHRCDYECEKWWFCCPIKSKEKHEEITKRHRCNLRRTTWRRYILKGSYSFKPKKPKKKVTFHQSVKFNDECKQAYFSNII